MANEIEATEFHWQRCPFCGCSFNRQCDVLSSDKPEDLSIKDIKVQCRSCGAIYTMERVTSWQVRKVASGKPLRQEVAEFLVDRERRLVKAHKRLFNV